MPPERLGPHNDRVGASRELLQAKGRREQARFAFEGPTLLGEALASGIEIVELFVTERMLASPGVAEAASAGARVAIVDERTMRKLSDVETPTGLVAVASWHLREVAELFAPPGLVLVLADTNDPGNAGTLVRSAEAFGARGVVFGRLAVDPYHPKVVRAAMGSLFRLGIAVGTPQDVAGAAAARETAVVGLAGKGDLLSSVVWGSRFAIVVGHERRGLGEWESCCTGFASIPMSGPTDSLNAAVAGSIALYKAAEGRLSSG